MTLCSNNGGLLKAGVSMDPYSSSFIRPDPSSVATERVMHCGPVQDTPTAASSAEVLNPLDNFASHNRKVNMAMVQFQSTERGWIGGDLTGRKEGLKNEEVAAVPVSIALTILIFEASTGSDQTCFMSSIRSPAYKSLSTVFLRAVSHCKDRLCTKEDCPKPRLAQRWLPL